MVEATHIEGRTASGNSRGCENISRPGLRSGESSGLRGNARVRKFHAADHGVNTRTVHPRRFSGAALLCVFQLWVQEGTAVLALSASHPDSVAESFLKHR